MSTRSCYWCNVEVDICPVCFSEFTKMPTCPVCQGTGFLCPGEHGVRWQGSVPCPPEHEEEIDNWLRYHVREDPWQDPPTADSLPWRGNPEALSYIAFMADFNVMNIFPLSSEATAAVRWLTACRNSAIQAGGNIPRVLRAGPLPVTLQAANSGRHARHDG
jgi:hypothetical protein